MRRLQISKQKAVVIDASVAQAAGNTSTKPQARACYETLRAVRKNKFVVVMSRELFGEWKRHMSRFAEAWLTSMQRHKRVERLNLRASDLRLALDALQQSALAPVSDIQSLRKDLHLIEAALQIEELPTKAYECRRVLSLDRRVRHNLERLRAHLGAVDLDEVCSIQWVCPLADEAHLWLRQGASPQHRYRLCQAIAPAP